MESLHEHNQKTYANICHMYDEGIQRVAVVQPTGSGKSLLMAKLIEDNPESRFFVLSTNHKINDQFKEKLDEEMLKRIDFNIYCNMPNMKKEDMESLQPDYILLDEMHRALAKEWSKGIKILLEMYPDAKVLGLSATPIRYLDKCRNVVKELFDGNLACDMNLSQAILDGILPMARYVCGVYSYQKDAESLNKKIEKSYNSEEEKKELLQQVKILKENLDKGNGVSDIFKKYIVSGNEKFVVFLKDTKHLRRMRPVIEKWFEDAGFSSVRLYEVHSKNPEKDKEFQAFKEDTKDGIKLCLSVNMVAEGIHGDINGVIMLRETMSPNFYFQMIGRAFSCGKKKKTIPLIFDLVANSQFISDSVDNFPNELKGEIEKRKEECEKENKDYEVGFDIDEFIVMDQFMDVVSGFRAIEERLEGRRWTEEEIEILRKYYPIEGSDVLRRLQGRTKNSIFTIVYKLGIKAPNTKWTKEEDNILRKYYPQYGRKTIIYLPNRPINAIASRANELGLYVENLGIFSKEEDDVIKKYYLLEGSQVYKRLQGKTGKQCRSRAKILGIKYKNTNWCKEEDDIIKKYYIKNPEIVYKKLENRSKVQIMQRASRLKIRRKSIDWTFEEDETVLKYYPTEGVNVYKRLNGRTKNACRTRAIKLGVAKKTFDKWTDNDYKIFAEYYPIIGSKVSEMIGKTPGACTAKASKLGIKYNRENIKYVYKNGNNYEVHFVLNGQTFRFGSFKNKEEAVKVAMEKAKEYGKAI